MNQSNGYQNAKVIVLTALISAGSTVAVAVVGVLPQLQVLQGSTATLSLSGELSRNGSTEKPMPAELYLLSTSAPDSITRTDDNGRFRFDNVLPGTYWIVVSDLASEVKRSVRVLITAEGTVPSAEIPVDDALIRYSIDD